ncbi:DUF6443 domain-containing protein [Ekhidna sp. MALMAid0563]|uniref:DUF6443 domain-containing protein n=1 Tax=Ekhidna sp. MALMAid0563 TaxID=3143937 RepID=UPI0032DF8FB4
MRTILFFFSILSCLSSMAQSINGPSTASPGSTKTYSFSGGLPKMNEKYWWEVSGGGSLPPGCIPKAPTLPCPSWEEPSVDIKWSSSGTVYLTITNTSTGVRQTYSKYVSVCTPPNNPIVPDQSNCGDEVTLAISSPSGSYQWFFDDNTTGLPITNGTHNGITYSLGTNGQSLTMSNLSASNTVYVRKQSTGCGHSGLTEVTATGLTEPQLPFVSNAERCGTGTITLSASPGSGGNSIKWYDSPVKVNAIHTGVTFSPTITTTTTYYVASYNTSTNCVSDRLQVDAIVQEPSNAGTLTGTNEFFGVGTGTISLGGNIVGDVIKWQYKTDGGWNDISATNTDYNYSNLQEPTYFRAVVKNGLCSSDYSNQVLIDVLEEPEVDWGLSSSIRPNVEKTITIEPGHASYKWFLEDSLILEGSTELIVPMVGRYRVVVTSTGGAVDTTGWVVIRSQLDMNQNAVVTYTYKQPIIDSSNSSEDLVDHFELELDQQNIAVSVFDGLGRLSQSIAMNATPDGNSDILTPTGYDELGRQSKSYLPYVEADLSAIYKPNSVFDPQTQGYQSSSHYNYYTSVKNETKAYAETRFEPSPLNRPLEQGAPGQPWQIGEATIKFDYDIADSAEVLQWDFETMLTNDKKVYGNGSLYKNTTTDEDGNQTVEYTNKQGQTILKKSQVDVSAWAETYYIYNIYGNLSVVLPPEASYRLDAEFFGQSDSARTAFLNTWAFLYDYDGRNRMTMKKVPGADSVFMVYDKWDRLVLTQDGNQRTNNKWLFTKYDALNRPIMTGTAILAGSTQQVRDAVAADTSRYETFDSMGVNQYTDVTYPSNTAVSEYLTITFYDHYNWDTTGLSFTSPEGLTMNTSVKGQVTGTMTKVGDGTFIKSVSYYDDKYRVIQTQSTNHLGGKDVVTNYYDFIGQVNRSISSHSDGSENITITRSFVYDHAGRLLQTWHKLNDATDSTLIAENYYNELGELTEKYLHGGAQSLDYTYNIRGWLTSVNDSELSGLNDQTPDPKPDLFGMELLYDEQDGSLNNAKLYNGNISAMKWSNHDVQGENIAERAYNFGYDKLNRLTSASHFEDGSSTNRFGVQGLNYDLNGNIDSLERMGSTASLIDDLAYEYIGNQLQYVADLSSDTLGFSNGASVNTLADPDYTYDPNGNMISDANKGITSIEYNHLNLPIKVVMSPSGGGQTGLGSGEENRIEYLYDAAGIKLQQKVYKEGNLEKTTDYVGEFIYETDSTGERKLQLIQHEEGRIVPISPSGGGQGEDYDYQYHLKDHLGNVRVTFSTQPENYTMIETFEVNSPLEGGQGGVAQDLHPIVNTNANTTPGGDEVELLQSGQTGAMIFLSVNKRDTIDLSVQANYESAPSGNNFLGTAFNTLFTAFDNVYGSGVPEGGGVSSSSTVFDGALNGGAMAGKDDSNTAPRAFLNYIYFDKDMNYIRAGFTQISTAARGVGVHEEIRIDDIIASRDGYILAYLSNENQEAVNVHFDDFTVYHGKTNVVSTQDYYPFGLTFNESVRTASVKNRMNTFQDQEYEEETGWVKFKWRNHQPDIGRFFNVDPLAHDYVYNSPYAFQENKMGLGRELEGLELAPDLSAKYAIMAMKANINGKANSDALARRVAGSEGTSNTYGMSEGMQRSSTSLGQEEVSAINDAGTIAENVSETTNMYANEISKDGIQLMDGAGTILSLFPATAGIGTGLQAAATGLDQARQVALEDKSITDAAVDGAISFSIDKASKKLKQVAKNGASETDLNNTIVDSYTVILNKIANFLYGEATDNNKNQNTENTETKEDEQP